MQSDDYLKAIGIQTWQLRAAQPAVSYFAIYNNAKQCVAVIGAQIATDDEQALLSKMLAAISEQHEKIEQPMAQVNIIMLGVDTPSLSLMLQNPAAKKQAWAVLKPVADQCKLN